MNFGNICRPILVELFFSQLFIKREATNEMELFHES